MGSGSNVNGIKVGSALPQYSPHMHESEAQNNCDTATATCGGKLAHEGRVDVSVSIDGELCHMELSNIENKIPRFSVQRMVRNKRTEFCSRKKAAIL